MLIAQPTNPSRYTTDTTADAEVVQRELIGKTTPSLPVEESLQVSSDLIASAKVAIYRRHPIDGGAVNEPGRPEGVRHLSVSRGFSEDL